MIYFRPSNLSPPAAFSSVPYFEQKVLDPTYPIFAVMQLASSEKKNLGMRS